MYLSRVDRQFYWFNRLLFVLAAFALLSCGGKDDAASTEGYSIFFDSANSLFHKNKKVEAFYYLDSSFASRQHISRYAIFLRHQWKRNMCLDQELYAEALPQADSMVAILAPDSVKFKIDYAEAMLSRGTILVKLHRFTRAFSVIYQAHQFVTAHMDTCAYARYSAAVASVLYLQKKYRAAMPYMWEVYNYSARCDSRNYELSFLQQQGSLDNIGLCYEHSGSYDSALLMYQRALKYIADNERYYPKDTFSIAMCRSVIMGNLGSTYFKMHRYTQAKDAIMQNLAMNNRVRYESLDAQLTLIKLAHIYIEEQKLDSVSTILTHIRHKLDSFRVLEEDLRWRKLAYTYYEAKKDSPTAYRYFKSYTALYDSIAQEERDLPGVDFDRTLQQAGQEHEIYYLQKINRFKNIFIGAIFIFLVLASAIGYLAYRYYKQSKANLRRQTAHNNLMQRTLTALEASQVENTKMMRVVAHDLHNPISAMISLAELLQADGGKGEDFATMVSMISQSGENALKVLNNTLRGQAQINKSLVQLDELVQQCAGLLQFKADAKHQKLLIQQLDRAQVMGDKEKLWRVINNLIVNAIKFSHEHRIIKIALTLTNDKALLTIEDQGIGIPADMQKELFDLPSAGRSGTNGEESFGLGLSISRKIVEAHGGTIWFRSEQGSGTTFFIELPTAN